METKRQKQINELLRRQFSMVLLEEGSYIFEKTLVTVTKVVASSDMQNAKIYLSVFNTDNKQEVILGLEENNQRLRFALANKIGKQIRRIPELQFYLDESLDEFFRMEKVLKDLRANHQMGPEDEEK